MSKLRKSTIILLLTCMLCVCLVGCKDNAIEDSSEMGQAIAKFLEVDKVELCTTKVVNNYNYVCFYFEGNELIEGGYSYAAFRKRATGDYILEFAQVRSFHTSIIK